MSHRYTASLIEQVERRQLLSTTYQLGVLGPGYDSPLKFNPTVSRYEFTLSAPSVLKARSSTGVKLVLRDTTQQLAKTAKLNAVLPVGHYSLRIAQVDRANLPATMQLVAVDTPTRLQADVWGSGAVHLNWDDNSDNEASYRVDRWTRLGWRRSVRVGANASAAVISNLQPGSKTTYRVSAVTADGVSARSANIISAATESEDTSGWYKVKLSAGSQGEASWTLDKDTMQVRPEFREDDANKKQSKWVFATSWQIAVWTTIASWNETTTSSDPVAVKVPGTDGNPPTFQYHSFPSGGDFKVGTGSEIKNSPNVQGFDLGDNDNKYIVVEDSYGSIDRDYDDFKWAIETEYKPAVTVQIVSGVASEDGQSTAQYRLTRTGSTTSALSVQLDLSGTAFATDYSGLNASVSIPSGGASKTITVTATADSDDEELPESIVVKVTDATGYKAGTAATQPATPHPSTTQATAMIPGKEGGVDDGRVGQGVVHWVDPASGGGRGRENLGSIQKETPPEVETFKDKDDKLYARVKPGTGRVLVRRSYEGQLPGDQGIGKPNAVYANKRVYISPQLASDIDKHEHGHVKATMKVYDNTLKKAVDRARQYEAAPLAGNANETEAALKARLLGIIDWNTEKQNFIDEDIDVNANSDTLHPNRGRYHAWETLQGGGPTSAPTNGPTVINGVTYDLIIRSREETDPNYNLPNYDNYVP